MQMAHHKSDKKYIRIREFCEQYSLSRSTAYRLFERGELTPIKKGGAVLLSVADIEAWLSNDAA
jgi:excisionase family DNA binding protein